MKPGDPYAPIRAALPLSEGDAPGFPCHEPGQAGACVAHVYAYQPALRAFVRREPAESPAALMQKLLDDDVPPGRVAARYGLPNRGTLVVPSTDAADPVLFLDGRAPGPAPPARLPLDLVRLVATAAHLEPPCEGCRRRPRGYRLPICGHRTLCAHCLLRLPSPHCPACGKVLPASLWPLRSHHLRLLRDDPRGRPPRLFRPPPGLPVDLALALGGPPQALLNQTQAADQVRLRIEERHPGALYDRPANAEPYAVIEHRVLERHLRWAQVRRRSWSASGSGCEGAWPTRDDVHRPLPPFVEAADDDPFVWTVADVAVAAVTVAEILVDDDDGAEREPVPDWGEGDRALVHGVFLCARASRWFRFLRHRMLRYELVTHERLWRDCRAAVRWLCRWGRHCQPGTPVDAWVGPRTVLFLVTVALEELHRHLECNESNLDTTWRGATATSLLPTPSEAWSTLHSDVLRSLRAWYAGDDDDPGATTDGTAAAGGPIEDRVCLLPVADPPPPWDPGVVSVVVTWDTVALEGERQMEMERSYFDDDDPGIGVAERVSAAVQMWLIGGARVAEAAWLPPLRRSELWRDAEDVMFHDLNRMGFRVQVQPYDGLRASLVWSAVLWYLYRHNLPVTPDEMQRAILDHPDAHDIQERLYAVMVREFLGFTPACAWPSDAMP